MDIEEELQLHSLVNIRLAKNVTLHFLFYVCILFLSILIAMGASISVFLKPGNLKIRFGLGDYHTNYIGQNAS